MSPPDDEEDAGPSFRVETEEQGEGVTVLHLSGKLAFTDAAALWARLHDGPEPRARA